VRELRNVLERAVIVAAEGEILLSHLPHLLARQHAAAATQQSDNILQVRVGDRLSEIEEAYIRMVLNHTKNNKTRAAAIIGISLRGLHNRLNAYAEEKAKGLATPAAE
jgi:DNA-binding NtrC family response regulator